MRHSSLAWTLLAVSVVIAAGSHLSRTAAQEGTPSSATAGDRTQTLVLVERSEHSTVLDLGEPGSGVGDMLVWGPNPLYDEANAVDTGAVTIGTCTAVNAAFDCVLVETITFPDGSALQFQGGQPANASSYLRTIVGGSGAWLGAIGTAEAAPSDDGRTWTRTIEVHVP